MSDKKYMVQGFLGLDINEIVYAENCNDAVQKLIRQIGCEVNYETLGAQEIMENKCEIFDINKPFRQRSGLKAVLLKSEMKESGMFHFVAYEKPNDYRAINEPYENLWVANDGKLNKYCPEKDLVNYNYEVEDE